MTRVRPPRLARLLLSRLLPRDVRDEIAGDLEERFARDRAAHGAWRARLRFWRSALTFPAHFALDRTGLPAVAPRVSALDLRLGLRMLARYPGLTLVGTIGIAAGIAIAAGAYSIIMQMERSDLPFEDGDRIVAIQNWDEERTRPDRRALHDYVSWKRDLSSVGDVGAFRHIERNLIEPGRSPQTVRIAEMSAAGFRITGIPPLMGRLLLPEDERPSAPPVAVIREDVWRAQLEGAQDVIGRPLQLGDTVYTIVGVMPAGYAFPHSDRIWIPFRLDPAGVSPRSGAVISVFGRLTDGVSLDQAKAELALLGQRAAEALPETHARLRPHVMPYAHPFSDMDDPDNRLATTLMQSLLILLLCIVCVNVSVLVYARTATRHGEIAIRTALGAGRPRIILQLFMEALVLSGLAAAVGLLVAAVGLRQLDQVLPLVAGGPLPFWLTFGLTPRVVIYAAGLAVLAAVIIGVLPALKATGAGVQSGLKTVSMGGGAGMQLGRLWTLLIIGQVAFTVALLPPAVYYASEAVAHAVAEPPAEAREFITASLSIDADAEGSVSDREARFAARHGEMVRRLRELPGISDVTFSLTTPGQEGAMFVEIDGADAPAERGDYSIAEGSAMGYLARLNRVDTRFFDTFDVQLLSGRAFGSADTASSASTIIVSRSFADQFYAGRSALGGRVRYVGRGGDTDEGQADLGRWYEIVGVVEDYPVVKLEDGTPRGKIYHAIADGAVRPSLIAIRTPGGAPDTLGDRIRVTAAAVDPNLQVRGIRTLAHTMIAEQGMWRVIAGVLGGLTFAVVTLSAAGIYALMSFTVAQRRREIGIRSALGADARRILAGIFARALFQLVAGAATGLALAILLEEASGGEMMQGHGAVVLPLVALFMTLVGLAAAAAPARRGLRIHPTEALRDS